jgi:intracellular septation protein
MKFLFDLFPVILFFATFKLFSRGSNNSACLPDPSIHLHWSQEPILLATAVAIAATFCQVGWLLLRKRKVDTMLWVSLVIICVFGSATLIFRDPSFIQWKPTILWWLYAVTLAGAPLVTGHNLIRAAMEKAVSLPEKVWQQLNLGWAAFFAILGAANLVAIHVLSCDGWVNFKLFGSLGLMLIFGVLQTLMIAKYVDAGGAK